MNEILFEVLFLFLLISIIIGGIWYLDYGMKKIKEKHKKSS